MLDLLDILGTKHFDASRRTKLVRHQDTTYDLHKLLIHDQLEIYQSVQGRHVFSKCDQIVSFIGRENSKAQFFGVFDVVGYHHNPGNQWPEQFLYPSMPVGHYIYSLVENKKFVDLKGRVVIEWGQSTRAWTQWLKSKEVVEILPKGYVRTFPGYLDFVLDYKELQRIIEYPDSNKEWHLRLAAVAGIYLIADTMTGKQYVGSAYGQEGILGRWKSYAGNGHGENDQLLDLIQSDPTYANYFRFTVLRTLPKTITNREVIEYETLYKEKLGSRAFGLNSN